MATSPTSLLTQTIIYCKKLEQTTDEEIQLNIIQKLSKVHFTLDLLQSSGAGKIIRELSKKPGLVGLKASSLLKKLREVVVESQIASETLKSNKSTEKLHHKHSNKEKHNKEKYKLKEKTAELSEDAHFNKKHSKLKNYHITLKHAKPKDAKQKHSIEYMDSFELSTHNEHKTTELDISSKPSTSTCEKNTLKYFAGIKYYPSYDLDDKTTFKLEAVLPTLSSKKNECKSLYETTPTKIKDESSKYKNGTKSHDAKNNEVSKEKNHITLKHHKPKEVEEKHFIDKHVKHVKDKHKHIKNSLNYKEHKPTELDTTSNKPSLSSFEKSTLLHFSGIKSKPLFDMDDKAALKPEAVLASYSSKSHELSPKKLKHESSMHKSETKHDTKKAEVSKEKKSSFHKSNNDSKKYKNEKSSIDKKNSSDFLKHSEKNSKIKKKEAEAFTSSEALFEDCLSFNDFVSVKRKKKSKCYSGSSNSKDTVKKIKTSHLEISNSKTSHVPVKTEICDKPTSEKMFVYEKNFKIETDVLLNLPETQPNYKPLPHRNYSPIKKKAMSNEEAIIFTSSRREKTAVYSGKRTCYLTKVPTLFESCTRVLIENIDDIEYMGEIPYFLLESMLQRCTATQLHRIEDFNPHLLEDTDQLWEVHCKRDFRTAQLEESETWRELYWRTRDEQEKKLRNVTANISASIASSNPVRKAKLAYIDSVVKPPRDVIRRQMQNTTASSVSHRPASTSSSSFLTVPSTSRAWAFKPQKPKVAPLMAKTLKSMKQCFRR